MKEKEPWEMMQEEWVQSKEKEIKQIIKKFGYWEDIPESELEARLQSRRRELLDALLGTIRPEIKPKVEKELEEVDKALKLLRSSHKELVEQALKEGKPVPDEVLKDYPDLAEKYGEKATKLQEIPKELESLAKIARRYKNAEEFLEKFVLDPFNQKYVFTPDVRKAIVESGFITPEGVFDAESFYKQATAEKYKKTVPVFPVEMLILYDR